MLTPVARDALFQTFKTLSDVGVRKPKNQVVIDAVRGIGHRFRDGDAKTFLAKLKGPRPAAVGPEDHSGTDLGAAGDQSGVEEIGPGSIPAGATCTRGKVLSQKPETTSPDADSPGSQPRLLGDVDPEPPKVRRGPTETQLATFAIRDAAWRVVHEHHGGALALTADEWKKRNANGADALRKVGKSPDDVARMLRVAYTHPGANAFLRGTIRLDQLAERWPDLLRLSGEAPEDQEHGWDREGRPVTKRRGDFMPGFTTIKPERAERTG